MEMSEQILVFIFEKQNGRQKTKWPPNRKIEHRSLYGQSKQILKKKMKNNMAAKKQNGRQIAKLSITCSFLEL